jgi:hypothetical protein
MYYNAGVFDVSLTVSDGVENSTLLLENYITVSALPGVAPAPTGITAVCAGWGNTSYNTTGISGITTYDWVLEPTAAGIINGTGLNITIIWESGFLGDATLKVAGENICGTGNYSIPLMITRYLPEVTLEPFEMVCVGWPAFELTGGMPAGGIYSGSGITNGWFDPSIAGLGTHTITYTYIDTNNCENFATETILVDPCTGIEDNPNQTDVMIFPNPNNGSFTLKLNIESNDALNLKIINSMNEVVYKEDNISSGRNYSREIDLSSYAKGVYYLHVTSDLTNKVKKIILQK